MSLPYGQYSGENYSNPSTPLEGFPQWETVEHEQQLQQQQQQQSNQESPVHPTPQYPTIQLEESPAEESVQLHHIQSLLHEARSDTPATGDIKHLPPIIDTSPAILTSRRKRSSPPPTTANTSLLVRSGRSRGTPYLQQQMHPYRRPVSATNPQQNPLRHYPQREQQVRFIEQGPPPSAASTSSAMHSPAIPSPIGGSHIRGFGSTVRYVTKHMIFSPPHVCPSSPTPHLQSTLLAASPRPTADTDTSHKKRFIIRADVNYDPESQLLTAMLELPGVKKSDVRVTLSTCYYNRVRQLTVRGQTHPAFPPPVTSTLHGSVGSDMTIRERKFGEFTRTFPVPANTKVRSFPSLLWAFLALSSSCVSFDFFFFASFSCRCAIFAGVRPRRRKYFSVKTSKHRWRMAL